MSQCIYFYKGEVSGLLASLDELMSEASVGNADCPRCGQHNLTEPEELCHYCLLEE